MYAFERDLKAQGYKYICGCDEVGRGPMAGPLVTAAVILGDYVIEGLNDSKQLSPKKREKLALEIKEKALDYAITYISVEDVDKLNVYEASRQGMIKCIEKLKHCDYALTDAMPLHIDMPYKDIIKGDTLSASIAAASIIAKVERDNYMVEIASKYPEYGFEKHKGYVTKLHRDAIDKYGVCEIHRRSFAPVAAIIERDKMNKEQTKD